jgi:hypothetical protein
MRTRERQGKTARRTRPHRLVASYTPDHWRIAAGRTVTRVDVEEYRAAAPWEVERIAALARALLLAPGRGSGRLDPKAVRWMVAKSGRIACLIDFLMAVEELADAMTTPLCVSFTPSGEVRWQFAPAAPRPLVGEQPRRPGGRRAPRSRSPARRVGAVVVLVPTLSDQHEGPLHQLPTRSRTSSASMPSPAQTSSAASRVHPPLNTDSRRSNARSPSVSKPDAGDLPGTGRMEPLRKRLY